MSVTLKGMTWSHPRGYDPMVATAQIWKDTTGVEIAWDKRSLQDFESYPVEELARRYDLIVIDHPHVGEITAQGCLYPLESAGLDAEREEIAAHSVGQSYESYTWRGHQWAFPIDAAAQVQAYRPDRRETPATRWADVVAEARAGRVTLPLRAPHSLMCFYTLAANLGAPCNTTRDDGLIAREKGLEVLEMLAEISACLDTEDFRRDPIDSLEAMSEADSTLALNPLVYGYVSYGLAGFRPYRLTFADIPAAGANGPAGSALGGTGIAVSAFSDHPQEAARYAHWVAGGAVQAGPFAAAGGQPGHAAAWEDDTVNAAAGDFYTNTRATLEAAWVRPRHEGYMAFQQEAAQRLTEGLESRRPARSMLDDLESLFLKSF